MFRDAILKNDLIYNFKLIYYYIQNKYLFISILKSPNFRSFVMQGGASD